MKGGAYAWIMIITVVFIVGFLWILMSQIYYGSVFPEFEEWGNSTTVNVDEVNATYGYIRSTWEAFPMILIFGLIVYGIASSLRKEPGSVYG